jgi:hypothetical protein
MTERSDADLELGPADEALARRLDGQRPVPAAGFRGALARHLGARDPGYGPRPAHLRLIVTAYVLSGLVLMGLGALVATGSL